MLGLSLSSVVLGACTGLLSSQSHQNEPNVTGATYKAEKPSEVLAFPGAEGFGKYTTGGRGGKTLVVTNLNDSGPGSLREAIKTKGPRTIVFEVSGTIALESELDINEDNLTIAGQTAPGDGICVSNYTVKIGADNVIIRYMRFRLGDVKNQQDDALKASRQKNIIIDHCTMSWATDECASFYDNENFTMQWCIVAESLNQSLHAKGDHGYGGIWGGMGATFHHNLIAHHKSRMPRFCGARYHKQPEKEVVDYRNNVLFNWASNNVYAGERGNHNMVNNYYKPGPATSKSSSGRLVEPYQPYGKFYLAGNYVEGHPDVSTSNTKGVHCNNCEVAITSSEIAVQAIETQTAQQAYEEVLAHVGASLHRDAADSRLINEVKTGIAQSGKDKDGIIDSQNDVGGWPELKSARVLPDTDRDGIPDAWEVAAGLNPKDPSDAIRIKPGVQYTYLEVYMNSLVERKAK